jgi:two-component system response regulator FlrC
MHPIQKQQESGKWGKTSMYSSHENIKIPTDHIQAHSTQSSQILIVDDDAGMREMLLSTLSFLGLKAIAASNGPEALRLCLKNHFDLVITDLQMPGMDGWSLVSHIKKIFPETPVMMMTAQAKVHVAKDLKKSCFDSVLFKPFKMEQLQHEIQRLLGNTVNNKTCS